MRKTAKICTLWEQALGYAQERGDFRAIDIEEGVNDGRKEKHINVPGVKKAGRRAARAKSSKEKRSGSKN